MFPLARCFSITELRLVPDCAVAREAIAVVEQAVHVDAIEHAVFYSRKIRPDVGQIEVRFVLLRNEVGPEDVSQPFHLHQRINSPCPDGERPTRSIGPFRIRFLLLPHYRIELRWWVKF